MLSHVLFFGTLWTISHQTPLPMGFSRQAYQSRLLFPPQGHLPNPEVEPHLQCLLHFRWTLPAEPSWKPAYVLGICMKYLTIKVKRILFWSCQHIFFFNLYFVPTKQLFLYFPWNFVLGWLHPCIQSSVFNDFLWISLNSLFWIPWRFLPSVYC